LLVCNSLKISSDFFTKDLAIILILIVLKIKGAGE
jgi:hypothetical protein